MEYLVYVFHLVATDYQSKVEFGVSFSGSPGCNMTSFFPILHNFLLPSELLGLPKFLEISFSPYQRFRFDIWHNGIGYRSEAGHWLLLPYVTDLIYDMRDLLGPAASWTISGSLSLDDTAHDTGVWVPGVQAPFPLKQEISIQMKYEHQIPHRGTFHLLSDSLVFDVGPAFPGNIGIVAFWSWISAF